VNDELKDVDVNEIRVACAEQSRSGWTSIASRNRLYQFIALSDEVTQKVMREKVSMSNNNNGRGSATTTIKFLGTPAPISDILVDGARQPKVRPSYPKPKGTKR
jgi:hypothetical protein